MPLNLILHIFRRVKNGSFDEIKPCHTYEDASAYLLSSLHGYVDNWNGDGTEFSMSWTDVDKTYDECLSAEALEAVLQGQEEWSKPIPIFTVKHKQTGEVEFQLSIKKRMPF